MISDTKTYLGVELFWRDINAYVSLPENKSATKPEEEENPAELQKQILSRLESITSVTRYEWINVNIPAYKKLGQNQNNDDINESVYTFCWIREDF